MTTKIKKNTIGKMIKNAIHEMAMISNRDHYSSDEYFAPLDIAMEKVDAIMDRDPQKIFHSDWGFSLVVAAFEHSLEAIAYNNAEFGNPNWSEDDVQRELDLLNELDIYDYYDFLKIWREYREATTAVPGHQHVIRIFNAIRGTKEIDLAG